MTEGTKTGSLAAVVGIVALLAYVTSNGNRINTKIEDKIGKALFEKFTDPLAAASLKILRYDTPKEDYVDFELARDRKVGVWTIPSHESYPADAGKQMSEAANLFVGLKVVDIASQKKAEQALFGVVEPNKQNTDKGGEGVGMLVQMRDEKGDTLADLIIGKEIEKQKRYVRVPSEDVIYVVKLDTAPLSTDFKQWIEPDLLKLSSNDIETLGIRDYQIVQTQQGLALSRNYEADLNFATLSGQWESNRITSFESDPPTERALTPDEQLNSTKLNDIKNTLDNLKIADVIKKPVGLAADLKGNSTLLKNPESLMSLQRRGFFPNPNQKGGDTIDFYSKSGELVVTLKDGVQYLLRFGGAAGAEINAVDATDTKEEGKKEEGKAEETVSINRFMLVTARVDDLKFPEPALERLPDSIEEFKETERMKQKSTESPAATEKPSEPKSPEPEVSDAKPTEPSTEEPTKVEPPAKPEVPAANAEPTDEEWKERFEAAREKITKENQRKIDDKNDKLKKAKNKVAELNGRFADWYYVVSESDYKKLKIAITELIQPKTGGANTSTPSGGLPGQGAFPGFQP